MIFSRTSVGNGNDYRESVSIENETIRVVVLPFLGAKISEIICKKTGFNFLHCNTDDLMKADLPGINEAYLPPFSSGFDDCFPSVTACKYVWDNKSVDVPDHGFLWSSMWDYKFDKSSNSLIAWQEVEHLRCRFQKTIMLEGNHIKIAYLLHNNGCSEFDYIWSSHPMLNIESGDRIEIATKNDSLDIYWSSDPDLKKGDMVSWFESPKGKNRDYSNIPDKSIGSATKLFSRKGAVDNVSLVKSNGQKLTMSFDSKKIPFVGFWLCYGGWPLDNTQKEYTIGIEPTSSNRDDLGEAIDNQTAHTIEVNSVHNWEIMMSLFPPQE